MRLTVIFIKANAGVLQCLTKNNQMGAFGVYTVVSVDRFLVKCSNQLVVFDLNGAVQKIDFNESKIYCALGVGIS